MANALVSNPGYILPMGFADIQADDAEDANGIARYAKGQLGFVRDDFGLRIFRYMHNKAASAADAVAGGLYSRAATVSPTEAAGSTTTKIVANAASFTAHAQRGWLMYFATNGTAAGSAPEGQTAVILDNTTTTLQLDPARPLTATPNATGDTIRCYSLFDFIKSAVGDLVQNVFGVCVATSGITNGNWGVLQCYGYCPDTKFKAATALVLDKAVIADTEQVSASAISAVSLLIGFVPMAVNNPNASKALVHLNIFHPELVSA